MEFLKGRSSRSTLWFASFGILLAAILLALLASSELPEQIIVSVYILYVIAANVVGFVFIIRRLNDMNRSGWWILCAFIPLVNIAFMLTLLFVPGVSNDDR